MGVLHEAPQLHWIESLKDCIQDDWSDVVAGEWATRVNDGTWSTAAMRGWILQLYPFIHTFPKFLAEALTKVEDEYSRSFLIDNIRVEKAHAEHWLWMGEGFGIPRAAMISLAEGDLPVMRDVQSLTDWIWYINAKGSLAEAVAATSFAIEGVTGDLTRALLPAFEAYGRRPGVEMTPKTTKWFRNHAKYDDDHPKIALEVVTQYANTDRLRKKVVAATRRSLQLLNLALLTSTRAYQDEHAAQEGVQVDRRVADRRQNQVTINFADRRKADRRASAPLRVV